MKAPFAVFKNSCMEAEELNTKARYFFEAYKPLHQADFSDFK